MKPESPSQKQEGEEPRVFWFSQGGMVEERPGDDGCWTRYVFKRDYDRLREQLDAAVRERDDWRTLRGAEKRAESELEAVRKRTIQMQAVLHEVREFLDGQIDIKDGPEGQQLPNRAMSLAQEIDEIIPLTGSGEKQD